MKRVVISLTLFISIGMQAGCGATVPQIAEPFDRAFDPNATLNMEKQIKLAIWCELRYAVRAIRDDRSNYPNYISYGKRENTNVDVPLPDFWGAQLTLTFTVDEHTRFSPGVTLNTPMHDAPVNFKGEVLGADPFVSAITYGAKAVSQSVAFGLGGELSAASNRVDTYNSYYTMKDLGEKIPPEAYFACNHADDATYVGPPSNSSPFLIRSNLGVGDWLKQAWKMGDFIRSSRADDKITGLAVKTPDGGTADVMSYHIKFVVVSSINTTPTWTLVRVSTSSSPLLDVGRTRTHELLITVAPGAASPKVSPAGVVSRQLAGPSQEAGNIHNSQLFGAAVANALRSR